MIRSSILFILSLVIAISTFPSNVEAGLNKRINVVDVLLKAEKEHILPEGLLISICFMESHLNPKVVNVYDGGSPSYGLGQLKLATAKSVGFRGTPNDLLNPKINAKYAAKYLKQKLDDNQDDTYQAVAAYNLGHFKESRMHKGRAVNHHYAAKVIEYFRLMTLTHARGVSHV